MSADLLPDDNVHSSDNQTKLNDIWWGTRSTSGAGKSILGNGIPVLGADWTPIPDRHTTPETELGLSRRTSPSCWEPSQDWQSRFARFP